MSLPSAALIQLNEIEEEIFPSTIKAQLLCAISTLRRGIDVRRAKEFTSRLEKSVRLIACLRLLPTLEKSSESIISLSLKRLLDQDIVETFEKSENEAKSLQTFNSVPPSSTAINRAFNSARMNPSNRPLLSKPHYLEFGIRQCYEQVFRNQMKSIAIDIAEIDASLKSAMHPLSSLDSSIEHIKQQMNFDDFEDVHESCSVGTRIEEIVSKQRQSFLPDELQELIYAAVKTSTPRGANHSSYVLKQTVFCIKQVAWAEALISAAELAALNYLDDSPNRSPNSTETKLESESFGCVFNDGEMNELQCELCSTLGLVLARMMAEERQAFHSKDEIPAHSYVPGGIGKFIRNLIEQGENEVLGCGTLFSDLDARNGQFAASKYRDILRERKEALAGQLEMMSQIQGLKQAIVNARPFCSELSNESKGITTSPRQYSFRLSESHTDPCSDSEDSATEVPNSTFFPL
mmetsp:Transcript_16053/g.23829  ORF Transcript_16053/g.23829 Transcript_16053/m.23829 type:complete len:463 (+) Transcript_16053:111-1499(+)